MKKIKQTLKILAVITNIFLIVISVWYTIHLYNVSNPAGGSLMLVLDVILIAFSIMAGINIPEYFLFNPFLGKAIYHKSGEFYVDVDMNRHFYYLYDDKILYKKEIDTISFSSIGSEKQLLLKFKDILDNIYKDDTDLQTKKEFLTKSDGYVDSVLRREKRINKIL